MGDCTVECTVCGRKERPDMAASFARGWPSCCGYTMRLLTPSDPVEREAFYERIGGAVDKAIGAPRA